MPCVETDARSSRNGLILARGTHRLQNPTLQQMHDQRTPTRPATEIEPAVPPMPTTARTDGGRAPARETPRRPFDRPPSTDHAAAYCRDTEEIEPGVPDLRLTRRTKTQS